MKKTLLHFPQGGSLPLPLCQDTLCRENSLLTLMRSWISAQSVATFSASGEQNEGSMLP